MKMNKMKKEMQGKGFVMQKGKKEDAQKSQGVITQGNGKSQWILYTNHDTHV